MKKIILSLSILFTIIGCSTTGSVSGLQEKSMQVSLGTTKQEVIELLGVPGDRSFKGKGEAWQYCSTGWSHDKYLTVWFYEDKVEGLTTYNRSDAMGLCTQTFASIDWGQAPEDMKIKLTIAEELKYY